MTKLKAFALFLLLGTTAQAQTSVLSDVQAKLTLAEPKSVYKIGEPIRLILREGKHYLFQVWNIGAMNGSQVPSARGRERRDRILKDRPLVTLKTKED